MSMSLKLITCLACFTLLLVVVVWVIQIFMADKLYENVKKREMDRTAHSIVKSVKSNFRDINEQIEDYSEEYDVCIGLYTVEAGEIIEIHSSVVMMDNIIYNASPNTLNSFYQMATQMGGVYKGQFNYDLFERGENGAFDNKKGEDLVISEIYAEVFKDKDQNEYMLLLNSNVTLLGAARTTFGAQFGYTMILLVLVSVFMGYVLSRLISRPLKSMNESAKELANGKYDTRFSGGGYREINELSDTLNYAASELAKNDHLQKELLANISHDLRTPLTMIKGYGEVIRDIPGENTAENIQVIIDETTRLSELVNDMLDLSRIESGMGRFEAESFDITAAVSEVIQRYDKMTSVKSYDIRFTYGASVNIFADRSMVLQVVYNLINNAINYSGDDKFVGVVQDVRKDELDRDVVRISVIDHGEGIAKEDLPLIWERYYKVDKVHRRETVGTGLGLSIVKRVLERHEASYGVESTVGEGSVFWFEFPISDK